MNKKLLVDFITFDVDKSVITEAMAKGGPFTVQGVLQRAEAKNFNGRVYGKELLEREAQKYDENFIRERRALGELDHPDSGVVNLKNVSHNVKRMYWSGNDLMGEVEILTTPSGNILKELLNCGIKLGISSRGMGSVKKNVHEGTDEVQDDFELICFDLVSSPSTPGAYLFSNPNDRDKYEENLEEEKKYNRPNLPVTKEEINAQKDKLREFNCRMPKKILEAKARKRNKLTKRLEKVKQKAQAVSNQDDISEFSKVKQIEKMYRRELGKNKEKKS